MLTPGNSPKCSTWNKSSVRTIFTQHERTTERKPSTTMDRSDNSRWVKGPCFWTTLTDFTGSRRVLYLQPKTPRASQLQLSLSCWTSAQKRGYDVIQWWDNDNDYSEYCYYYYYYQKTNKSCTVDWHSEALSADMTLTLQVGGKPSGCISLTRLQ